MKYMQNVEHVHVEYESAGIDITMKYASYLVPDNLNLHFLLSSCSMSYLDLHRLFWISASYIFSTHLINLDEVQISLSTLIPLEIWLSNISRTYLTLSYMLLVWKLFFFSPYLNTAFSSSPLDADYWSATKFWTVNVKHNFVLTFECH